MSCSSTMFPYGDPPCMCAGDRGLQTLCSVDLCPVPPALGGCVGGRGHADAPVGHRVALPWLPTGDPQRQSPVGVCLHHGLQVGWSVAVPIISCACSSHRRQCQQHQPWVACLSQGQEPECTVLGLGCCGRTFKQQAAGWGVAVHISDKTPTGRQRISQLKQLGEWNAILLVASTSVAGTLLITCCSIIGFQNQLRTGTWHG